MAYIVMAFSVWRRSLGGLAAHVALPTIIACTCLLDEQTGGCHVARATPLSHAVQKRGDQRNPQHKPAPAQYGHLCNTVTCTIWPPMQYDYLCNMATHAIWPPMQYGHPCHVPVPYGRLCSMAACAIWLPVQFGHLCNILFRLSRYVVLEGP